MVNLPLPIAARFDVQEVVEFFQRIHTQRMFEATGWNACWVHLADFLKMAPLYDLAAAYVWDKTNWPSLNEFHLWFSASRLPSVQARRPASKRNTDMDETVNQILIDLIFKEVTLAGVSRRRK